MKSSNPILKDNVLENAYYSITDRPMTVGGTMNKLIVLSLVMLLSAAAVYYQFSLKHFDYVNIMMVIGLIVGLVCALVIAFNVKVTPYLAPIYAFSQGAALSAISCFFEASFPGIVIQAISMTFIVVFIMAALYKMNIIRATEKFRAVLFTATVAIAIFYLIAFILSFFNVNIPYFTSLSTLSIGINVVIAIVAALNLIIDFDFIERGVRTPLPSLYEWYGAFGLLVTVLWLYVEILRLLARIRQR